MSISNIMDDRTVEVLRRFGASWDQTKTRFNEIIAQDDYFKRQIRIREFIARLELAEGRKRYRLGTSIDKLIISRSVNHGLREDQKYISIEVIGRDDYEVSLREGSKTYRQYRIKDLEDIRLTKLLQTLESTLVN